MYSHNAKTVVRPNASNLLFTIIKYASYPSLNCCTISKSRLVWCTLCRSARTVNCFSYIKFKENLRVHRKLCHGNENISPGDICDKTSNSMYLKII